MKKFKNYILLTFILITTVFLANTNVNAKEISPSDIEGPAYVIGEYLFTRNSNKELEYDGKLTTSLIMLASKSIKSNNLEDMIIYYKTASGKWINGLSGKATQVPNTFEINYTDLKLESQNTTVNKPKTPLIYIDGPSRFNKETGIINYSLYVFVDDIMDSNNKIDGVEISVNYNSNKSFIRDLKANVDLNTITTITEDFSKKNDKLYVGAKFHSGYVNFDISVNNHDLMFADITVKAYINDDNGKKVYSDSVFDNIDVYDSFSSAELENKYSDPDYIYKSENGYTYYQIGLKDMYPSMFKNNSDDFGYELIEKGGKIIGIFKLNETATISMKPSTVKTFYAKLGYFDNNGNLKTSFANNSDIKYFTIDTRTLTTPVLSVTSYNERGEYLSVNTDFYKSQAETTLDYKVSGAEIYRVRDCYGSLVYELVSDSDTALVLPDSGASYYAARVYAINDEGKKVYSEFSDVKLIVRTPKIEISNINNGKITVSIANKKEYNQDIVKFEIYNDTGKLGTINDINDSLEINVSENMRIYAKAYNYNILTSSNEYSELSNIENVII